MSYLVFHWFLVLNSMNIYTIKPFHIKTLKVLAIAILTCKFIIIVFVKFQRYNFISQYAAHQYKEVSSQISMST